MSNRDTIFDYGRIEMPFLVLLVSGGHCLLSVVRDIDDFKLIGKATDSAPGDVFDKVTVNDTALKMQLYVEITLHNVMFNLK